MFWTIQRRQAGCLSSESGRAPAEPRTMMRRTPVCRIARRSAEPRARRRSSLRRGDLAPRAERTTSAPSTVSTNGCMSRRRFPELTSVTLDSAELRKLRGYGPELSRCGRPRGSVGEEFSGRSAGTEDGDVHGGSFRVGTDYPPGVGRGCEKSGWAKCIILFCLVNIPTVRTRSCSERMRRGSVKKWDNRIA